MTVLLLLKCANIFKICLTLYSVLDYGRLFAFHAYLDDMECRPCLLLSVGNVLIRTTV